MSSRRGGSLVSFIRIASMIDNTTFSLFKFVVPRRDVFWKREHIHSHLLVTYSVLFLVTHFSQSPERRSSNLAALTLFLVGIDAFDLRLF